MIYNNLLSNPRGRMLIGYMQVSLIIIFLTLEACGIGLADIMNSFFMPDKGLEYTKEYKDKVYDFVMFVYVVSLIVCITYGLRGMHKVNTWQITGHKGLEVFNTSFWSSISSGSWWFKFMNTRSSSRGSSYRNRQNINAIIDYVEGKNSFSTREDMAKRYASINNLTMMDSETQDYIDGKLSWMSRERGYEYIKGLNK